MRSQLREWARAAGIDETLVDAIVLSVSEAAANSIEHGLRYDEHGTVTVLASFLPDGALDVAVIDDGAWQRPDPRASAARGYGMRIIYTLMDDVGVEPGAPGTVVRMGLRTT
jgi:anti-sigma regulatory factor (Ser/Thr protein kinase)